MELCAWGPYAKMEAIDFSDYDQAGLFLITGPTGSGKTTIFDGITYALYGEVSGSTRAKDALRSDFADKQTETYVTLWFTHKGKEYQVQRSPRYLRPKKRGEGMIATNESALLVYDDQTVSGVGNVNRKIQEILSVGYQQFKQLSMIAQGEFQKLLIVDNNKKVNERVDILRNIFQTQLYEQIQNLAGEKARKLRGQIKELQLKMEEAAAMIPLEEKKLILARDQHDFSSFISLVDQQVRQEQCKIKDGEKKQKQLEEKLQMIRIQAELEEKLLTLKTECNHHQNEMERLRQEEQQQREAAKQMAQEAEKQLERRQLLKEREKWFAQLAKISTLKENMQIQKQEIEQNQKKCSCYEEQIDAATLQLKQWQTCLCEEPAVLKEEAERLIQKNAFLQQKTQMDIFQQKVQQYQQQQRALQEAQQCYRMAKEKREQRKQDYERLYSYYQDNLAGVLAETLKDECPCPVCGSCNHPQIAIRPLHAPTKEQVRNAKKDWDNEEERYLKILADTKGKRESVLRWEEEINREQEQVLGEDSLTEVKQRIKRQLDENDKSLEEIRRKKETFAQIRHDREVLESQMTEKKKLLEKLHQTCQKQLQEFARSEGIYTELKQQLPTDHLGKEQIKQEIEQLKNLIQTWDEKNENVQQTLQNLLLQKQKNRTLLEEKEKQYQQLEKKIQYKVLPDQALVENEYQQQKIYLQQLYANLHQVEKAMKSLRQKNKDIEKLEKQYGIAGDVDALVNGKNARALKLEQYVLMAYFDDILKAANQRLSVMTDGRYELYRVKELRDGRQKNHLDMEVFDYYTGKRRPVKSLSGGESFKAALSMALGLSDIVQNYAGGIQIEVLFIDEGFGSLDEESLSQAVETLKKMSANGCTIGIISHVAELKEKIEAQIIIEKSNTGSKIRNCSIS